MTPARLFPPTLLGLLLAVNPAAAQQQDRHGELAALVAAPDGVGGPVLAETRLMNRDGEQVGAATFQAAPTGTLVRVAFVGLNAGVHGLHVHETGVCEGGFESAGGHFNRDDAGHGYWHEDGYHAGDLPNVHVPDSGRVTVEFFSERLRINDALFDDDGAALVLHAGADDYRSQPSGDSGERLACGVLNRLTPEEADAFPGPARGE